MLSDLTGLDIPVNEDDAQIKAEDTLLVVELRYRVTRSRLLLAKLKAKRGHVTPETDTQAQHDALDSRL